MVALLHYCSIPLKSLHVLINKNLSFYQTNETELIPFAFGGSTLSPEVNTQRTKPSLQATKSSSITHF